MAQLSRSVKIQILLLIAVSVVFRILWLDHIPGINGDDAWLPVQIRNYMAGGKFTFMTVSNRIIAPTYGLLQFLVTAIPVTNVVALRLPILISGLATPLATFLMFRRTLSPRMLWFLVLIMSVLPVNMAYSRSMAEMSQVPLAMVFAFGFLWLDRYILAMLAWIVGLSIHPTCIFLLPLILGMVVHRLYLSRRLQWKFLIPPAGLLLILLGWQIFFWPFDLAKPLRIVLTTLQHLDFLPIYAIQFGLFFLGAPIYEYFSGAPPAEILIPATYVALSCVIGVLLLTAHLICKKRNGPLLIFVVGFALSLVGLFLLSGSGALSAGYERFALFLVVPGALLLAWVLDELLNLYPKFTDVGSWIVVVFSWILLAGFYVFYFENIRQTGGTAHVTYRTAEVEPKLQAYNWIREDQKLHPGGKPAVIVEDWWLLWPMKYFHSAEKPGDEFKVLIFDPGSLVLKDGESIESLSSQIQSGGMVREMLVRGAYLMGFAGQPLDQLISAAYFPNVQRHNILDYSGKPVLSIWRIY